MSANIVTLPVRAPNPRHTMEEMRKRREFNRMVDERVARGSESREVAEHIVRATLVKLENTLTEILLARPR